MAESTNLSTDENTELTMCDVLQEEEELEEDANAVLGGSDDTNCSYDKGYVPRQALYACTTCSKNGETGGVCLACCYACHDGHEVVELYTKRNFRCDCGNSKFPGQTCTLRQGKDPFNVKNKYNQNFKGLYCSCSRPYPDLDDDTPDEMIQCIMCEDWYHSRHIGGDVPDDYFEMICSKCMGTKKFLYAYLSNFRREEKKVEIEDPTGEKPISVSNIVESSHNDNKDVSVPIKVENIKSEAQESDGQPICDNGLKSTSAVVESICSSTAIKKELKMDSSVKQENVSNCILKKLIETSDITTGPAFWPENYRKELCHCPDCMIMYIENECEFLLNPDDTIQAYEERGKSRSSGSGYDKGLSALGQLDRVKQMEAVRAYTNMKGQLKEYLKEFADNKRTVCESDIKEFFDRISKRQRLNNGVPHFCR